MEARCRAACAMFVAMVMGLPRWWYVVTTRKRECGAGVCIAHEFSDSCGNGGVVAPGEVLHEPLELRGHGHQWWLNSMECPACLFLKRPEIVACLLNKDVGVASARSKFADLCVGFGEK